MVLIPSKAGLPSDLAEGKQVSMHRLNPLESGSAFGRRACAWLAALVRLNPLESGSAFGLANPHQRRNEPVLIPSKAGLPSDEIFYMDYTNKQS